MKFKMAKNSVFAMLLRSRWWVSFAIAIAGTLVARLVLTEEYQPYAPAVAFPFFVTGVIAAWQQWREPSEARIAATLEAVSAMSWREFAQLMEAAFTRDGHSVTRTTGAADFILMKDGRTALVCCKRWKAVSHGLQPLAELVAERRKIDVTETLYVAASPMTDNALRYAAEYGIGLMRGPELTRLLRLPKKR